MGFDVKSLTGAFESYETTLAGIAPITDTATGSTKKLTGGINSLKIEGESASSMFQDVGQVFKSSFSSAFSSIVDRTSSVKDAYSSMGQSILTSLTQLFAQQARQSLYGDGSSGGRRHLGAPFKRFYYGAATPSVSRHFGSPRRPGSSAADG